MMSAGLWDSPSIRVCDMSRLARSETAVAMSVGPSKAAIVFDVVMPCPLGFASSVGRVLLASTRACACPEDGDQERRNQDALSAYRFEYCLIDRHVKAAVRQIHAADRAP